MYDLLISMDSNQIYREVKIMQLLRDGPYILPLLDVLKDPDSGYPMLVTKWVESIYYRVFLSNSFYSRIFIDQSQMMNFVTIYIKCLLVSIMLIVVELCIEI